MNTGLYHLYNRCDQRVAEVFDKLTKNCDKEKLVKVIEAVLLYERDGKTVERAMADALETYKLDGAVNAGNADV